MNSELKRVYVETPHTELEKLKTLKSLKWKHELKYEGKENKKAEADSGPEVFWLHQPTANQIPLAQLIIYFHKSVD